MTSPVNLPQNTSSQSAEATQSQSASGKNKRSAPGSNNLAPNYPPEIIRAAPTLNTNNSDQVCERPAKMQRRGAMATSSQFNAANLQPSQSGLDRAKDDVADLFAGSNLTDKKSAK